MSDLIKIVVIAVVVGGVTGLVVAMTVHWACG